MNRIKKSRGLRRYYQNLERRNEDFVLTFSDWNDGRFNLWHRHFDWYGYGNHSFKSRKPHLDKLFRHFDLLNDFAKSLKTGYQLWITVLDCDSASDALFLHTANPNQSGFPWKIMGLAERSTLTNQNLIAYIDSLAGYEKQYGYANEAFCVLYKKNAGLNF